MDIKIEADGGPCGTRVLTVDGQDITSLVDGVAWEHRAGEIPRVRLHLALMPLHGVGLASMVGPGGKEVRSIEYADGTRDEFG
jgi:hypothetical protein